MHNNITSLYSFLCFFLISSSEVNSSKWQFRLYHLASNPLLNIQSLLNPFYLYFSNGKLLAKSREQGMNYLYTCNSCFFDVEYVSVSYFQFLRVTSNSFLLGPATSPDIKSRFHQKKHILFQKGCYDCQNQGPRHRKIVGSFYLGPTQSTTTAVLCSTYFLFLFHCNALQPRLPPPLLPWYRALLPAF